eukprot:3849521-Amphidinium_carterae.2
MIGGWGGLKVSVGRKWMCLYSLEQVTLKLQSGVSKTCQMANVSTSDLSVCTIGKVAHPKVCHQGSLPTWGTGQNPNARETCFAVLVIDSCGMEVHVASTWGGKPAWDQ